MSIITFGYGEEVGGSDVIGSGLIGFASEEHHYSFEVQTLNEIFSEAHQAYEFNLDISSYEFNEESKQFTFSSNIHMSEFSCETIESQFNEEIKQFTFIQKEI